MPRIRIWPIGKTCALEHSSHKGKFYHGSKKVHCRVFEIKFLGKAFKFVAWKYFVSPHKHLPPFLLHGVISI